MIGIIGVPVMIVKEKGRRTMCPKCKSQNSLYKEILTRDVVCLFCGYRKVSNVMLPAQEVVAGVANDWRLNI
mgnify:CR=1 FL=1